MWTGLRLVPLAQRSFGATTACGHCLTLVRTTFTCLGALLAMLHWMLAALGSALATDLSAEATKLRSEFRTTGHECRSGIAQVGAVAIKRDTADHGSDVRLLQAG